MSKNLKKLLILNIPYLLLGLLFTKLPEAWRYANGADIGEKILGLGDGFSKAFAVPLPSFYPTNLLIGLAIGGALRLAIYLRSKNAKKYRKGVEYGSARWGNAEDIEPYVAPTFQDNVILTQTERLTMNSRPQDRTKQKCTDCRR